MRGVATGRLTSGHISVAINSVQVFMITAAVAGLTELGAEVAIQVALQTRYAG
jgi:hypothetical protein